MIDPTGNDRAFGGLESQVDRIDIPAEDGALLAQCDVQTFRSTGPGGQGVNTTDSAVRLRHVPSGVVVTCRARRSQYQNKAECLRRLRLKLEALNERAAPRLPTSVPRAAKRRVLESKRRRSVVKRTRRPPDSADD
jgi:protein subunit release factor B